MAGVHSLEAHAFEQHGRPWISIDMVRPNHFGTFAAVHSK